MVEAGLAQPRYVELGAQHARKRDYDDAAAEALAAADCRGYLVLHGVVLLKRTIGRPNRVAG